MPGSPSYWVLPAVSLSHWALEGAPCGFLRCRIASSQVASLEYC